MAETIDWVSALSALGATDLVRDDVVAHPRHHRQDPRRPGEHRRGGSKARRSETPGGAAG